MDKQRREEGARRVPFWRSLRVKYAMTYLVIVAAVVVLLNTYPVMVTQTLAYQSKQTALQNQASVLASALATGPEALTQEGATKTVSLLLGSLGVTRVVVTDPSGLVLCDFQEGSQRADTTGQYAMIWEIVTALQGNDVFRSDYADGVFHSRAAVPVTYRSMTQGAVYLYEYDAEQGAMLQGIQTNLRFISLVICLVTLVMGVVFAKALTRRIALLLGAIRTVREGEYSHRVSMGGGDELSRLADEFNELTGRLQTTEEVRRRFVSDASHELKTPLASIRLLADSILQNQEMDRETVQDFVSDIGEEAERLTRITEKLLTHGQQTAESDMEIILDGEGASGRVVSRSVAQDNSQQVFYPKMTGNAKCFGHVQCDSIIMGEAKISSIPAIVANHVDAQLIHEAAIGRIAGDQILKLMTLGLTEQEAEEKILDGFLQ